MAAFAINDRLDCEALTGRFVQNQRVQIADFLSPSSAQLLHDELVSRRDWRHVINGEQNVFEIRTDQYDEMPATEKSALENAMFAKARAGFQFQFDTIRVPDGAKDRCASGTAIDDFACFMGSAAALDLLGTISATDDIAFADAQATRYRHGDFLTRHDDNVTGKNRRLAYVLSLSPQWQPEWGGLLLFNAPDGTLVEAMAPRFNTLSLFAIGQPHSVSYIAPYAGAARLSITGWLRAEPPPP